MRQRKAYLIDEKIIVDVVQQGAYVSRVQYTYGQSFYDVFVENDELEYLFDEEEFEEE